MSFLFAFAFKGIRRCVQAAKQLAVWLSSDCNKRKVFVGVAHTHNL